MPNDKPQTFQLTFSYMQTLIRTFLKRPCSCHSKMGQNCPLSDDGSEQWHTWRRLTAKGVPHQTDASVFVKPHCISVNIHKSDIEKFKKEMTSAGWTIGLNDKRSHVMTRFNITIPNMVATKPQLEVLKDWVQKTVGAF